MRLDGVARVYCAVCSVRSPRVTDNHLSRFTGRLRALFRTARSRLHGETSEKSRYSAGSVSAKFLLQAHTVLVGRRPTHSHVLPCLSSTNRCFRTDRCSQDTAANAPKILFTHSVSLNISYTNRRTRGAYDQAAVTAQGFTRKMSDGSVALVLLNRQDEGSLTLSATWTQLGLGSAGSCAVRDLINQRDLPRLAKNSNFTATVGSHTASLVRITC